MSMRYKGGVISATPPTTSTSAATGVWTLVQQMQAQAAGAWPLSYGNYWIGLLGGTGYSVGNGIATDSAGNAYICGLGTTYEFQIAKYGVSGGIAWQRRLSPGTGTSVAVDSSSNVYFCGYSNTTDLNIIKCDTSGIIQWQRKLTDTQYAAGFGVGVDSSNNVYVIGQSFPSGGTYYLQVAKYNSSGTIQWQRRFGGGVACYGRGVALDSSGNVYITGYSASAINSFLIIKYNSSGTLQWQRSLSGASSTNSTGYGIAVDSSSNVYVCGFSNDSGSFQLQIAKYNSSGTIQWQRNLGSFTTIVAGYSVAVDSSNNIYVSGYSSVSSNYDFQIAKYNSSGAIQWQRRLGGSGVDYSYSITISSAGDMYVTGYATTSDEDIFFAKLPSDGSLTGTYTVGGYSVTYAASTLTDSVSALTDSSAGQSSTTSTLTDAASSLTDSATTLTSSVTGI